MGDLRMRFRIEAGATTQKQPTYSLSVPVVRGGNAVSIL